jgi:hypothetical protein
VNGRQLPFEPEGQRWLAELLPRIVRDTGFGAEARVARILEQSGVAGVAAEVDRLGSDWVRRRYVVLAAEQATLSAADVGDLVRAAGAIGSDYELAEALLVINERHGVPDPAGPDFFAVVEGIGSDYERRRVLEAVARRPDVSEAGLEGVLRSAASIGSDYERATVLSSVAGHAVSGSLREPYLAAAQTIGSDYDRARAMEPLLQQLPASAPAAGSDDGTQERLERLADEVSRLERDVAERLQADGSLSAQLARARAELVVLTARMAAMRAGLEQTNAELARIRTLQEQLAVQEYTLKALDRGRPEVAMLRRDIDAARRELGELVEARQRRRF